MPYISPERRAELAEGLDTAQSAGELNYEITCLLLGYLSDKGEGYQTYNDILGVLEGAKMEFYRRMVVRYEDAKRKANGDVYP